MVLSKPNKKSPLKLGETFINLIKKNDEFIENIDLAKPGFINIKFKNIFWSNFAKSIIDIKNYGSTKKNKKKYLVEFVSANPTGPLHVGHCRGAVYGDALCNLLKFCDHKVTKEYYVNDHGNQIKNFSLSVYFRIKEKLFNVTSMDKLHNFDKVIHLHQGRFLS